MQVNLYEVMGIQQDYPQERIPQAFRNRAKQIHPDKHHPDSRDEQKQATIMLLQAYRVLNDPVLRYQHDQALHAHNLHTLRYFQQTNLQQKGGKLFVECEQCVGETEIAQQELLKAAEAGQECFVRCWHCGLALSIDGH